MALADQFGKMIVLIGVILIIVGLVVTFFDRIPLLGKLPGDIHVKRDNFQLYIPLATSVLISAVMSLILWLVNRR